MIDPEKDEEYDFDGSNNPPLDMYYSTHPSALGQRFSRLHCRCLRDDISRVILRELEHMKATSYVTGKQSKILQHCQKICEQLQTLHHKETTEFKERYCADMIALSKMHVINPPGEPGVQTSAWEAGVLQKMLHPPRKRTKKDVIAGKRGAVRKNAKQADQTLRKRRKKKDE